MSLTTHESHTGGTTRPPRTIALEPPPSRRRQRAPELAVGILLVVGCALAALILATDGRERTAALALSSDIARGEVITSGDLATVYIESDSSIAYTAEPDAEALVGRAALSDLAAGTMVTPEQLASPIELIQPGAATVGMALEAGQLPSLRLAPGDAVSIVAGGDVASGREPGPVVDNGRVVAVEALGGDDQPGSQLRWWVAVQASEVEATALSQAISAGARVQLVLIGN